MKTLFTNTIFIFLVRVFLGGIFVLASLDKLTDPQAFSISILNYKVVGEHLAMLTATILPSLEFLCGVCLILGLFPRTSSLLITVMLIGFTILVISALIRGLDISCGCFTQDPEASKIGYYKIMENAILILLGVYLSAVQHYGFTILRFFSREEELPKNN